MQYVLLIRETPEDMNRRNDPAQAEAYWGGWTAYGRMIAESGVMRGGEGLMPPDTATTLRVRDGQRLIEDGPYADTKELLGGFFIVEVADLDAALEIAAKCPALPGGSVEVRPTLNR